MKTKELVRKKFSFLFEEYGFNFDDTQEMYDGIILVAKNNLISLKFVFDRANFFLDILDNSSQKKWISFYDLLKIMKKEALIFDDIINKNSISHQSYLLGKYYTQIIQKYSNSNKA